MMLTYIKGDIMLEDVKKEVQNILSKDRTAHGYYHAMKVCNMAVDFAKNTDADLEVVRLAALLHDVDDYKFFGKEYSEGLLNAKMIMNKVGVSKQKQDLVCDILSNMGYSKLLEGYRPTTIEGQLVSDADMLESNGANAIVKTLTFGAEIGRAHV